MSRSKSSQEWINRQQNDEYVLRAQKEGYRSRAVYKLLELQEKDKLIKPGMNVVDLGAAPGGWCQIAQRVIGNKGNIVGLDILDMDPIPGVTFIKGDFRDDAVFAELEKTIKGQTIDLVISDIAPNISGMAAVDLPKAMYLCELALEFARDHLKQGGAMAIKVFQGEGFDQYLGEMKSLFTKVVTRKPKSSRKKSREVYLVATGRKL